MTLLPTGGASEAIALVMHELASTRAPGRSRVVAVPTPAYGAFRGLTALLGLQAETYEYSPSGGWEPKFEDLLALSRRCRALVVTNPHNPTGYVMDADLLARLSAAASISGCTLIIDEVFRVVGETASSMIAGSEAVVIGSLSKTYGLPGLRLGWVAARRERVSRLRTVQQYLTLSLSAMTVGMGAQLLARHERFSRAELIRQNRIILTDWAKTHPGILVISAPMGGTTVCLTVKTRRDEMYLFDQFLKRGVLVAPGRRCFGIAAENPWFRIGYATEPDDLRKGLQQISDVIASLGNDLI